MNALAPPSATRWRCPALEVTLRVPLRFDRLKSVKVNGQPANYRGEVGFDRQVISVRAPAERRVTLEVSYSARTVPRGGSPRGWPSANRWRCQARRAPSPGRRPGVRCETRALEVGWKRRAGRPGSIPSMPGSSCRARCIQCVWKCARFRVANAALRVSALPGQALLE